MVALNIVHAACPHDCPDTCAIAVTVEGMGASRRAVKVEGDAVHADTAGFLCAFAPGKLVCRRARAVLHRYDRLCRHCATGNDPA
ncbi:MAG: hypothetical protein ACUVR8_01330 [Acidobacteriota bacterium]